MSVSACWRRRRRSREGNHRLKGLLLKLAITHTSWKTSRRREKIQWWNRKGEIGKRDKRDDDENRIFENFDFKEYPSIHLHLYRWQTVCSADRVSPSICLLTDKAHEICVCINYLNWEEIALDFALKRLRIYTQYTIPVGQTIIVYLVRYLFISFTVCKITSSLKLAKIVSEIYSIYYRF